MEAIEGDSSKCKYLSTKSLPKLSPANSFSNSVHPSCSKSSLSVTSYLACTVFPDVERNYLCIFEKVTINNIVQNLKLKGLFVDNKTGGLYEWLESRSYSYETKRCRTTKLCETLSIRNRISVCAGIIRICIMQNLILVC